MSFCTTLFTTTTVNHLHDLPTPVTSSPVKRYHQTISHLHHQPPHNHHHQPSSPLVSITNHLYRPLYRQLLPQPPSPPPNTATIPISHIDIHRLQPPLNSHHSLPHCTTITNLLHTTTTTTTSQLLSLATTTSSHAVSFSLVYQKNKKKLYYNM